MAKLRDKRRNRLGKQYHLVAVRQVAVRGAHLAFPHLTAAELGAALGLGRHQVRHYLLGDLKSVQGRMPAWSGTFFEACSQLTTQTPGRAAQIFERLARELFDLKQIS